MPVGSGEVLVMAKGAGLMTKVAARVAVCWVDDESATWTVNMLVPAVVGVPERTPAAVKVRPAGRVPVVTLQV